MSWIITYVHILDINIKACIAYSVNIIVPHLQKIDIAILIRKTNQESKAFLETAGVSAYDDPGHSIRIIIL